METNNARKTHPLILAAAAAVILFAGAGTAALMGWLPDSRGEQMELRDEKKLSDARTDKDRIARPAVKGQLGVIESVREVKIKGEGTGLGAVVGGVAGGVAGHQIGGGRGKDAMTVIGTVGGGVAGHEAEKHLRATKHYEVAVRFDDGTSKVYLRDNPPAFKAGDRVRVTDGDIQFV
jgi:outer membrane lipoprotein SlyB